jgi:alkyldihydroxyacetonephosphate synthase
VIQPELIGVGEVTEPSTSQRALVADLARLCGGHASAAAQDRIAYARDLWPKATFWAGYGRIPRPPDAICWPGNAEETAAVLRFAKEKAVPITPFGAGSGVCGGGIALFGGITVDLKRMERLTHVDRDGLRYTAETGIVGEVLERRLAREGLSTGHFPSSIICSTLGGWIAARGAGQLSTKYGKIEDMIEGLTAVLGTGEVVRIDGRPSAGPDLVQLLTGSEGTLGMITEARMFAVPQPEARRYRGFRFRSLTAGAEAIRRVLRDGLRPAVVRLYDPFDTALVGKGKGHAKSVDTEHPRTDAILALQERVPGLVRRAAKAALSRPRGLNRLADLLQECLLVLVFEGAADLAEAEDEQALFLCRELGGEDLGPEPGRHWMEKRYAVSYKQSKMFDAGGFADTMEVACTWERVVPTYEAVRAAVSPLGFIMAHLSHAYLEGCSLYFTFTAATGDPEETAERYDVLWSAALNAAANSGATVSHHHGIGFSKADALHRELGPAGSALLRSLKRHLDPKTILNPGKLGLDR